MSILVRSLCQNAVDFHCHGIGQFDFTDIINIDLLKIENILKQRQQKSILTLYLPKQNFKAFIEFMEYFSDGKCSGKFNYITGIGLEGPLLASHGGTPSSGVWFPNKTQWRQLAAMGKKGLTYIILSPDFSLETSNFYNHSINLALEWIVETLLEGGVMPAPGHFVKSDPQLSAKFLQTLFNKIREAKYCTITDHLYNDMPKNFKHAWRTSAEKKNRAEQIKALEIFNWSYENIETSLGIVPATIIKNAKQGTVKVCQNFDGEHVDLEIVKKTVEILGSENMLMMTDSIESKILSGRILTMQAESTLLYQQDGIVAAGTQNVYTQIKNMINIGLTEKQIKNIVKMVPNFVLSKFYQHQESIFLQTV